MSRQGCSFDESIPASHRRAGQFCALHTALSGMIPTEEVVALTAEEAPGDSAAIEVFIKREWDHLPDAIARHVGDVTAPWRELKIREVERRGTPEQWVVTIW